jgi:acetoin utilization deacetylase AcuC-like enzyme
VFEDRGHHNNSRPEENTEMIENTETLKKTYSYVKLEKVKNAGNDDQVKEGAERWVYWVSKAHDHDYEQKMSNTALSRIETACKGKWQQRTYMSNQSSTKGTSIDDLNSCPTK